MYIVVIAWLFVVILMAVVEATSSVGTVLGAIVTFVLYGVLPLSIVMFIMGTPGRRRVLHAQQMKERAEWEAKNPAGSVAVDTPTVTPPSVNASLTEPDAGGHAASAADAQTAASADTRAIPAVRKEP